MWFNSPQFATPHDLGRVALVGCLLGLVLGIHIALALFCVAGFEEIKGDKWAMIWQWSLYAISVSLNRSSFFFFYLLHWLSFLQLCIFHILEFFVTAIYNPTVATSDSFLVNHSKAYTAANIFASSEFFLRFIFFPRYFSAWLSRLGILMVLISQSVRSLAMITCGESFNHLIQTQKKENHKTIRK